MLGYMEHGKAANETAAISIIIVVRAEAQYR